VAFGRCRKCRGGTPRGERARKARAASQDAAVVAQRLSAFRFLDLPEARLKELLSKTVGEVPSAPVPVRSVASSCLVPRVIVMASDSTVDAV